MHKYLCCFVLFLLSCPAVNLAVAQADVKNGASKSSASQPDYSKEAFIDEEDVSKISFENNGTGTREWLLRIRIQSDAGVQRYSVLTFPYSAATDALDIDYVRVRKPDGSVITTPSDNFQDMPTDVTRQAPFYSDLHEKHVAVKGLTVGDVLEAHALWTVQKPLAPGQFWYAFSFSHDFIVLHQELQVSVPRERAVKWKSTDVKPVVTEASGKRVFTWTSSQLEHKSDEAEKKEQNQKVYEIARGKLPAPDVQISTFQSWEEVGAWYNALQEERVQPSPEIRAKAAELTQSAKDDTAKLHAIYNYVSTQFRYIGIAFGIGRYQPHTANEILANQYGDCKDKHTLLASLLDAAGIKAYPALIGSMHALDADVPSPAQFDHVITAVPQGAGYLWLDSTAEVAPFGYLLSLLRGKPALVVKENKRIVLVNTGAPDSSAVETFTIDAKLDDHGTLDGQVERSMSGDDAEVLFRAAFRRTPATKWRDLVQEISRASGFSGEVSDVTVSAPEKTDEPFRLSYTYHRKDFPQWSEKKIAIALPPLLIAAPDEQPSYPLLLSPVGEMRYESHIEIPKGYTPQLPSAIDVKEDFGEYRSSYAMKNGALEAHRKLLLKVTEIPLDRYAAYKKFSKVVSDEYDVQVSLMKTHITPASYQEAVWALPYSDKDEALAAYGKAQDAFNKGDTDSEIASLRRAVKIDAKFTRAWLWLSEIYVYRRDSDHALEALHSAIANDPEQPLSYKGLGFRLMGSSKFGEAIAVWRQLITISPGDSDGPEYLAATLSAMKRYSEAAESFETAIKLAPNDAGLYMQLGSAYLSGGNVEKALAAYKKTLELDQRPVMFNDVGYELAEANAQLPLALEYARKAVQEEEQASAKTKLSDLKTEDLGHTTSLAAFWDTLGWVYFRAGDYSNAEKYLYSAWFLTQDSVEADHLGQVYEKQHNREQAVRMYRLSLASARGNQEKGETQARLDHLGGVLKTAGFGGSATDELNRLRTFRLETITSETSNAEFFISLTANGVAEVKFISGSEKLKSAERALRTAAIKAAFPDDGPALVVRRGVVGCYPVTGCNFVLYNPYDVRSVN